MFEFYITKKHYHTLDYYLKAKYNKKVFKVPLNASFTCPNRDGTKGIDGCYFCSSKGSGDFAGNESDSLEKQYELVSANIAKKWNDAYKIVYYQAYTNTYGTLDKLKECFEKFKDYIDVIGISIATRCDCLDIEKVRYIASLKKYYKEVWVELGLQSCNDKTKEMLNMHYTNKDFVNAVNLLNDNGIDVIAHIIDGLPNETEKDMLDTIKFINSLPIKGLKIHILNVIDGTKLSDMYKNKKFTMFDKQTCIDIIVKQISCLKKDVIIHRIGADVFKEDLLAPDWIIKKLSFVDNIDSKLKEANIYQGDNVEIQVK